MLALMVRRKAVRGVWRGWHGLAVVGGGSLGRCERRRALTHHGLDALEQKDDFLVDLFQGPSVFTHLEQPLQEPCKDVHGQPIDGGSGWKSQDQESYRDTRASMR